MLYCLQGDKSTDSANIEDGLHLVLHFDPNPADRTVHVHMQQIFYCLREMVKICLNFVN